MDTMTISALVAIVGCIVGVAGWWRNASKDDSELAAAIAAIQTSLGYIEQQLAEIKSEFRRMETDVADAAQTAGKALATANAAHDRLDALGADTAAVSRQKAGGTHGGHD